MKKCTQSTVIMVLIALLASPAVVQAQMTFNPDNGCLNVIDVAAGLGLGDYGDRSVAVNYMHEKFLNEHLAVGVGVGYNHRARYDLASIPVFLSSHYFLLDKHCSPFVNLRIGGFGILDKQHVNTGQKFSLSNKRANFNLYFSAGTGFKIHLSYRVALMASVASNSYLLKVFDTKSYDYKDKLVSSIDLCIGLCFQIDNW